MNFPEIEISSKLPYPEIELSKNIYDAKLLMNDYAGKVSETTATMQYMYQYYIVSQYNKNIAEVLKKIAIVEMRHHQLLGNTIVKLGGDPIISGLGPFWNGSALSYTKQIGKMLLDDIESEETTIRNYTKTAMSVTEKSISDLIYRIILDEEIHIKALKSILEYISFWSK